MVEFTSETISACCFLFEDFINYQFGFLTDIGLFILLISPMCVLVLCVFQGIGLLHLSYKICGHKVVRSILYCHFKVHGICTNDPYFISDIVNFCVLSNLICYCGLRFISFIDLFKSQWLVSLIFPVIFLFSILLTSALMFIISFPLLIWGLNCSLSSFQRYWL